MFYFYEILAGVFTPGLKATIAQKFGISEGFVSAWGRAPESEDNPFGTGKPSYFDHVCWLIRRIHKTNPAAARLIVEKYNQELEQLENLELAAEPDPIKSQADLLTALIRHCAGALETLAVRPNEPLAWQAARLDIIEIKSYLNKLDTLLIHRLEPLEPKEKTNAQTISH